MRCQLVVPIARSVVNQLAIEPLSRRSSAVLIALAISVLDFFLKLEVKDQKNCWRLMTWWKWWQKRDHIYIFLLNQLIFDEKKDGWFSNLPHQLKNSIHWLEGFIHYKWSLVWQSIEIIWQTTKLLPYRLINGMITRKMAWTSHEGVALVKQDRTVSSKFQKNCVINFSGASLSVLYKSHVTQCTETAVCIDWWKPRLLLEPHWFHFPGVCIDWWKPRLLLEPHWFHFPGFPSS